MGLREATASSAAAAASSHHGIIGEDMHVELLLKYYNVPPCWKQVQPPLAPETNHNGVATISAIIVFFSTEPEKLKN